MATPYIYLIKLLWKYEENVMLGLNGEKKVKTQEDTKGSNMKQYIEGQTIQLSNEPGQNDKKNYLQHSITQRAKS